MNRDDWPLYSAVAGFATVGLFCLVALWMQPGYLLPLVSDSPLYVPYEPSPPRAHPQAVPAQQPLHRGTISADEKHYEQLRSTIRWVSTAMGGEKLLTPDLDSRLVLAKSAATRAGLSELGLGFTDVYGLINAETSWIPRTGASKNGTPNLGIAQFEPATARALGLRDPDDAVEAVHVAAVHMKEAAVWSAARIAGLRLSGEERDAKLREGISIYYNLSTRGRNAWNGRNTHKLPRETQLHIQNARIGAQQAEFFEAQLQAAQLARPPQPAVLTARR
jgi:hypothetical protein